MAAFRRNAVIVALATVPALAACQLVLGLDEFSTDGGPGNGSDGSIDSAVDGSNDANVLPEVFAKQVDWAGWRMPNPIFDGGVNGAKYNFAKVVFVGTETPDAGGDATLGIYTDKYVGEDSGTGLFWILTPTAGTTKTVAEADVLCAQVGGHVPSRIELVTLLDFSRSADRRMEGASALLPNKYWTSSPVRPYRAEAGVQFWSVSFDKVSASPVIPATDGLDPLNVVCAKGPKK